MCRINWKHAAVLSIVPLFLILSFTMVCPSASADEPSYLHELPVVRLTIDPHDLWDPQTGLFAEGDRIDKSELPYRNALYHETGRMERAGHIRMTMRDGTVMIDQDMMVSLYGSSELDLPQKSFAVRAMGDGFHARLFDDSDRTMFSGILLRNSSSDAADTHIRQCLTAAFLNDYGAEIVYTRSRNVALYINDQYWGLYQLEESADESWAAYTFGTKTETTALLNAAGDTVLLGTDADRQAYQDLVFYVRMHPPCESEANLSYLLERVDADETMRFMALMVFFGNADQSTIRIARNRDGRWLYVWQDSTWCMTNSAYKSAASCMKRQYSRFNNALFLALMDVPAYRDTFLSELGRIYRHFTTEKMISIADALSDEIRDEMLLHCVRWRDADLHLFHPSLEGLTPYESYQFWQSRIERLRNTCRRRPAFVWWDVQNTLQLTDDEMQHYFGNPPASWQDLIKDAIW